MAIQDTGRIVRVGPKQLISLDLLFTTYTANFQIFMG